MFIITVLRLRAAPATKSFLTKYDRPFWGSFFSAQRGAEGSARLLLSKNPAFLLQLPQLPGTRFLNGSRGPARQ